MEDETLTLPQLRQDLQLQQTGTDANDEKQWLVYDPIKHAYHVLDSFTLHLLQHWLPGPADAFIAHINTTTGLACDTKDIETLLQFIHQHELADEPRGGDTNKYMEKRTEARSVSAKRLLHSYVFFRIPILKPQKLLNSISPYANVFFRPIFWLFLLGLSIFGFALVARQWDQFVTTFFGFLSLEGLLGYGFAIVLTKIAHEFGHAFAAHRYGCRVTSMGVGFMLFFPILYADTTDAWRLKSRRKRLVIGASGMGAEIIIAILATLAWNILPDGSLRAVVFFLATTSWLMTLLINLNPFMRFDGYYLLSDALDFKNLHPRSNALARWWLRETLFQAGEPCPERLPKKLHRRLIAYAIGVWIYRFFLFLGIALLLHNIPIKAVAIILATVEIGWFIVRPIILEIKEWPPLFKRGKNLHRLSSMAVFAFLLSVFFLPWQGTVKAPAVIEPAQEATIFAGLPGIVETVHVSSGQYVLQDQPLLVLHSPALATEILLTQQKIDILQARINRQASDDMDRAQLAVIQRQLTGEFEKLSGLEKLKNDMILRAPISGIIHGVALDLHEDRWVNEKKNLMHIRGQTEARTTAYISENDLMRITPGSSARFFGDDPLMKPTPMSISAIAPAGTTVLDKPILASVLGGSIATRENERGEIVPVGGIFRVILDTAYITDRDIRGMVHISGKKRSPASSIWRRIVAIYNRESGS